MLQVSIYALSFVRRRSCDGCVHSQTVTQRTRGLSVCKHPSKAGHTITPSKTALMHAPRATSQQVWRTDMNAVRVLPHLFELPFSDQSPSFKGVAIALRMAVPK